MILNPMPVVWVPTNFCPLYSLKVCAYCGYLESTADTFRYFDFEPYAIGPELQPEEWVRKFNGLPNANIDLTGGEPFAYKGLHEVVLGLPRHRFSFTTNLMYDVKATAELPNAHFWTCSYHYMAPDRVRQRFWAHLEELAALGRKNIAVTVVAYPDAWDAAWQAVNDVRAFGVPLNVHPYYAPDHVFPEELLEDLHAMGGHQPAGLEAWAGEGVERECFAGLNGRYAAFGPDGTRYRCYTHLHLHRPQVGHETKCSTGCWFPCDWERVEKHVIGVKVAQS